MTEMELLKIVELEVSFWILIEATISSKLNSHYAIL